MQDVDIKPVEKSKPQVVAKTSKISGILEVSDKAKKSSLKLKRTFEKGIYQKRTQLSVLNRYKRRLDRIELEDDRRTRVKSRKKIQLPSIKKFAGNFFSPGSADDPFKAIGVLAAFNAATKASSGDWLGAFAPALVAGGALLGPTLLGAGANKLFNKGGNASRGFDKFGRRVSKSTQQRYAQRYGDKAFKNRFGKNNLKNIDNSSKQLKVGKAFGRFGKAIIPGVGAVVGAIDATLRSQEGDTTGAAIAGTSASLDALAAASAGTGIGLPIAGLLSIASFGLDVVNLVRDLSGASENEIQKNKTNKDALKIQTEKQKKLVANKKEDNEKLTFKKTLNRYERVIDKFDKFSKSFSGSFVDSQEETKRKAAEVENKLGDQSNMGDGIPGEGFRGQVSQYLTGDPNVSGYDPSHGTQGNYHDHLAFKDRETAERAYKFLTGKNIKVTELQGYGSGVTGSHSGRGSLHHSGLAFDVPGYQWGGSGAIGATEYRGSARVRALMNEFFGASSSQKLPDGMVNAPNSPNMPNAIQLSKSGTQIAQPQSQQRNIAAYTQYAPSTRQQQVIPFPMPLLQQANQPVMMQQSSSALSLMQGPSEEQVLNSFYKRILLNTLQ